MVVYKASAEDQIYSSYDDLDIINDFVEMHNKDEKAFKKLQNEDAKYEGSTAEVSSKSHLTCIESDSTIYLNESNKLVCIENLENKESFTGLCIESNSTMHTIESESTIYSKNIEILNKISNGVTITANDLSALEELKEKTMIVQNPPQEIEIRLYNPEDEMQRPEEQSIDVLELSKNSKEVDASGGFLVIAEKPLENDMSEERVTKDTLQEKAVQCPRIQGLESKCIISHSDKIIPYDNRKTKKIKSKKQNVKRNVYEIGEVGLDTRFSITSQLKIQNRSNHKNEFEESNQPSAPDPVVDVLDVVRMQRSQQNNNWVSISNTFFVGKAQARLNITDVVTHADFIEREIYDKLEKRSRFGKMTENYVVLTEKTFSCYRSKKKKVRVPNEEKKGFPCFEDQWFYFPEKYCVDLKDIELFIITGSLSYKKSLLFCCSNSKLISSSLQNINAMEINSIQQTETGHSLFFQNESGSGYDIFEIGDLDFVLLSEGEYHWFRCQSSNTFSKWITAIQLRRRELLKSAFE
ncbi:hypothetical protein GINT2_001142 [Glugoides intestinalis]